MLQLDTVIAKKGFQSSRMHWYEEGEYENEEEDLMFSPAILARRASESWIIAPPVEVHVILLI